MYSCALYIKKSFKNTRFLKLEKRKGEQGNSFPGILNIDRAASTFYSNYSANTPSLPECRVHIQTVYTITEAERSLANIQTEIKPGIQP